MAVDTGDGLCPTDAAGIMRFRERGGGQSLECHRRWAEPHLERFAVSRRPHRAVRPSTRGEAGWGTECTG
jgi:hypothetical protein